MTLERADGLTVEGVQAVRDRPLEDAYEVHDVGYAFLVGRLTRHGLAVVDHGDDARHADEVFYGDGPDLGVYDVDNGGDGGDGGEIASSEEGVPDDVPENRSPDGYVEIKCKESEEWFGRLNRRHFTEYVNFHHEADAPVFIWFALVDAVNQTLERDAFFEVTGTDQIDGSVVDVSERTVVFPASASYEVTDAPDDVTYRGVDASDVVGVESRDEIVDHIPEVHGNEVVCLDENQLRSFPHFLRRIEG